MREREGVRAWGGARHQGRAGQGGLGWARLGRTTGRNPLARTTIDRNPNVKRKPKRD
jgi:hypothetical protein